MYSVINSILYEDWQANSNVNMDVKKEIGQDCRIYVPACLSHTNEHLVLLKGNNGNGQVVLENATMHS